MNITSHLLGSIRTCFLLLAMAAGLACSGTADAQEWARSMFEEFQHDFGQVEKGTLPEHRFKITNKFKEPIRIRGVYSSCGCTSVSLTKNMLKTWESAELICRFNTPVFDGFKQATVTVAFDYPYVGEVQLNVRGTIVNQKLTGLKITPKDIDFGQASINAVPSQTIEITRQGNPNFKIVDVKSTFKHIGIRMGETIRNQNSVTYRLQANLKPTAPNGISQGELFVIGRDRPNDARTDIEIPLKFRVSIVAPLQVTPEILTLSQVPQGQEVKRKVIIKADQPFHIKDVTSKSTHFRVRADRNAFKKVHFVDVIYNGQDIPGRHENELNFVTDLATRTVGTMKAIVEVLPEPAVETTADGSN